MNFFQQLHDLNLTGDLKMVTTRTDENAMVVSLLLANEKCGDQAAKTIAPLLLRGTPAELDEAFFETIGAPMQKTSGLMVDMEAYLKSVEKAQKESKMVKENKPTAAAAPAKPAVDPLKVAYDKAMATVEDLIKSKKYTDAIKKLPDPKVHVAKKKIIEKRRTWLMGMVVDGGGMFPEPYPVETDDAPVPVVIDDAKPAIDDASTAIDDAEVEENEEEEVETENE